MSFFSSALRGAALAVAIMAAAPSWAAQVEPTSRAGTEPVIRVVFNTEPNPPIVYGSGTAIDPDKPSLIVDMLRLAAPQAGVSFIFQRVPWQRGLYMIETGQADAIFASSFTAERTRYGAYPMKDGRVDDSRRIHQMSYSLFVRQNSEVGWSGHTISGLRAPVGATPEFAVVPMLREMGVALDLEGSTIGNLRKLRAGRIDAYAEIDTLAEAALRTSGAELDGIVKLTPPLRTTPYFLMFSKTFYDAHPEVAERVWDAIAAVRTSPAYRALTTGKYAD